MKNIEGSNSSISPQKAAAEQSPIYVNTGHVDRGRSGYCRGTGVKRIGIRKARSRQMCYTKRMTRGSAGGWR